MRLPSMFSCCSNRAVGDIDQRAAESVRPPATTGSTFHHSGPPGNRIGTINPRSDAIENRLLFEQAAPWQNVLPSAPQFDVRAATTGLPIVHHDIATPLRAAVLGWRNAISGGTSRQETAMWSTFSNDPTEMQDARSFLTFLNRLYEMEEYSDIRHRPALYRRIGELLNDMESNTELRRACFSISSDAGTNCCDRVANVLASIEEARINMHAEQGDYLEPQLLDLGRGMFRQDSLGKIVRERVGESRHEEIELYLAVKTRLAARLNLPFSIAAGRYCGGIVTNETIDAMEAQVLAREQSGALLEFFVNWGPWEKCLAKKHAESYADMMNTQGVIKECVQSNIETAGDLTRVRGVDAIDDGVYMQLAAMTMEEYESIGRVIGKEWRMQHTRDAVNQLLK